LRLRPLYRLPLRRLLRLLPHSAQLLAGRPSVLRVKLIFSAKKMTPL
jgi:hypothetical protein